MCLWRLLLWVSSYLTHKHTQTVCIIYTNQKSQSQQNAIANYNSSLDESRSRADVLDGELQIIESDIKELEEKVKKSSGHLDVVRMRPYWPVCSCYRPQSHKRREQIWRTTLTPHTAEHKTCSALSRTSWEMWKVQHQGSEWTLLFRLIQFRNKRCLGLK